MFFLYPFFIKLLRIEPFCCECSHPTDSWEPSEELPAHSQRRCMRIRCFCPVLIHSSFYSRELVKDKVFPLDNRVVFRVTYFRSSFPSIHRFSTVQWKGQPILPPSHLHQPHRRLKTRRRHIRLLFDTQGIDFFNGDHSSQGSVMSEAYLYGDLDNKQSVIMDLPKEQKNCMLLF